jgi:hypothetical protein
MGNRIMFLRWMSKGVGSPLDGVGHHPSGSEAATSPNTLFMN